MAQKAAVPKFGNWEGGDKAPSYTQTFDFVRKSRDGRRPVNPNDPQDYPDAFSSGAHPVQPPPFRLVSVEEIPKTNVQHHVDKPSSADHHRRTRPSGESEHNLENSPLHPHYQAKSAKKAGQGSPSWERRGASEGILGVGSDTPGRSRLRPSSQGEETPEKGSMVPKFGTWDESDPSSAEGYSDIFEKVREERKTSKAKVPMITADPDFYAAYPGDKKRDTSKSSCCPCFSW